MSPDHPRSRHRRRDPRPEHRSRRDSTTGNRHRYRHRLGVRVAGRLVHLGRVVPEHLALNSDCAQAGDDVGHLVAAQLPGVTFTDLACGGTTADLVENTSTALSPATRYVSISTGGNNEDFFMDLLQNCFVTAATCTPQVRQEAEDKLDRLGARLDSTYATVRAAAPTAEIVVLGYLRLLPDRAAGCIVDVTLGQDVVDFGNHIQHRLNDEVARAAERAGFTMVNRWQDGTNSVCAPDGQRHVSITGLGPGDEALPYHPTITGRRYAAGLIVDAFLNP